MAALERVGILESQAQEGAQAIQAKAALAREHEANLQAQRQKYECDIAALHKQHEVRPSMQCSQAPCLGLSGKMRHM